MTTTRTFVGCAALLAAAIAPSASATLSFSFSGDTSVLPGESVDLQVFATGPGDALVWIEAVASTMGADASTSFTPNFASGMTDILPNVAPLPPLFNPDLNNDGTVSPADMGALFASFFGGTLIGDINEDLSVDAADFNIINAAGALTPASAIPVDGSWVALAALNFASPGQSTDPTLLLGTLTVTAGMQPGETSVLLTGEYGLGSELLTESGGVFGVNASPFTLTIIPAPGASLLFAGAGVFGFRRRR